MTRLRYLDEMDVLTGSSRVEGIVDEDRTWIELESSHFHPQGGGQPADHGMIGSFPGPRFSVDDVRLVDGVTRHYGSWTTDDRLGPGAVVDYQIDPERRRLLTRIHSAGHIIDMAVRELEPGWKPGKGYHFPDGPYVEYEGTLSGEREEIAGAIEASAVSIVGLAAPTTVRIVRGEELESLVGRAPAGAPTEGPVRVVMYGEFGVPCGGTHVSSLDQAGRIIVRKIRAKKGLIRVSYDVERES